MSLLDVFVIARDEEELVQYCLESFESLVPILGVVAVVDNNSSDATLDIVYSFKDRLPLKVAHHRENSHHGQLRNKALELCDASPWVFYLDSDETFTIDMRGWFETSDLSQSDIWMFYKYTTILDRYHYMEGGNGPTLRLFRHLPGAGFPQSIHTEPTHPGFSRRREAQGPLLFDHTSCKSAEALWAKGIRYQWGYREGVPAVGPIHEYKGRMDQAYSSHKHLITEFPDEIKNRIFTGPTETKYVPES